MGLHDEHRVNGNQSNQCNQIFIKKTVFSSYNFLFYRIIEELW